MGSKEHPRGIAAAETAAAINPLVIATSELPAHDQFDAWRAAMSAAIDVRLDSEVRDGFPARQFVWNLGSMAFARAEMPGGGRVRSWTHLKRNPLDHWCLVLVVPAAGQPVLRLRSLARPFEAAAGGADTVLTLYLPRDLLPNGGVALDRLHDREPEGPLAGLLADHMQSLDRRLPDVTTLELSGVAEATRQLIAACLLPGTMGSDDNEDAMRGVTIDRARRVVRQNIGRPDFGPLQLGRALGMSRSRLYRQFEPLGGVTHYIRRQRLLAAHAALSDANDQRAIVEIAEAVGFTDASSFSRAFRGAFGYSPSDARLTRALGGTAPTVRRPEFGPPGGSLADILLSLCA